MHKTVLIIFGKKPALGHGKQRLAKETNAETAFLVAKKLLAQTLIQANEFAYDIIFSPSSSEDCIWSHNLFVRPIISIPQLSGGLGERLMQVDQEARMLGYKNTLFIGTDAPLLSTKNLHKAAEELDRYDTVFIPATDGGVVLMGNRKPWADLNQVNWSTEKVFTQLKSIATRQGHSYRLLREQIDLDDLAAYQQLRNSLIKQQQTLLTNTLDSFFYE